MTTLRASKQGGSRDAYRVLMPGLLIGILLLVGLDPAMRLWDRFVLERPWVQAVITLVPGTDDKPDVAYELRSSVPLSGAQWGWVETEDGRRICSTGTIRFLSGRVEETRWAWDALLEDQCDLPDAPYRLCMNYSVITSNGARGSFGPFCSGVFRKS